MFSWHDSGVATPYFEHRLCCPRDPHLPRRFRNLPAARAPATIPDVMGQEEVAEVVLREIVQRILRAGDSLLIVLSASRALPGTRLPRSA